MPELLQKMNSAIRMLAMSDPPNASRQKMVYTFPTPCSQTNPQDL